MITDILANSKRYCEFLPALFKDAFDWIETHIKPLPELGKHPLPNGCFAIVQKYYPKPYAGGEFENHHKYIDLQVVLGGAEAIYTTQEKPDKIDTPYSGENDIEFFKPIQGKDYAKQVLRKGGFTILWPGDWHMPCIELEETKEIDEGAPEVFKCVVKIPIN
jgi:YhcH/YjgK/YiaL family protein